MSQLILKEASSSGERKWNGGLLDFRLVEQSSTATDILD